MLTIKELLVSLLESFEQMAIDNAKMQLIILDLSGAKSSRISLDNLIQETQLSGDTERMIRWAYSGVRQAIQQRSDPEPALKTLLEQFPRLGRLH
jgi:hypothetical protein